LSSKTVSGVAIGCAVHKGPRHSWLPKGPNCLGRDFLRFWQYKLWNC